MCRKGVFPPCGTSLFIEKKTFNLNKNRTSLYTPILFFITFVTLPTPMLQVVEVRKRWGKYLLKKDVYLRFVF